MKTQIDILKEHGLQVKGHLGQHLLIDPNIQKKTVALLDIQKEDRVLEIGPGLGALTAHLLENTAKFWAVEMDERFVAILKTEYAELWDKNHVLIHSDILDFDLKKIRPSKKTKGAPFKVISNLPYYITAPILFHLLGYRGMFSRAVFTMQKEVAQRLVASPGSKDYGRLTLGVRYSAEVKHVFDIPPSCFTPQPAVGSSVVVLEFYPPSKLLSPKEEALLFHIIQVAFSQRRKMLLRLLSDDKKLAKTREEMALIFEKAGILPTARGEELILKDYLTLLEHLKPAKPAGARK